MNDGAISPAFETHLIDCCLRNVRATFKHLDAAAIADGVAPVLQSQQTVDRFCLSIVEGGMCWRDLDLKR